MQTIHRHIARSFLLSFGMSLLVVTVVMSLGLIFKVNDLLVKGVEWRPILMIVGCGIPPLLALSIPMSLMTASLLVFGRLSADGEITAMRACGISMHQILHMPVLLAVLFTVICVYVNQELGPRGHYARKLIEHDLGVETPLELLEIGRFVDEFPGLAIYIGRKQERDLFDIRIRDTVDEELTREIRAKAGHLRITPPGKDGEGEKVILELVDARVNPLSLEMPWPARLERMEFNLSEMMEQRIYLRRTKDYTMMTLIDGIVFTWDYLPRRGGDMDGTRMELLVELNKRLALSFSCFAFVVLGVPLGIRAHRRESSIGVAISLVLVFNFYLFIIVAESLGKYPMYRPDLITWLPVPLALLAGSILIRRND